MTVVGIVGGIASGKSAVADLFRQLGAGIIQADAIGHEVLEEPDVVRQLRERWGDRIIGSDGHVNRAAIASIVFGASKEEEEEEAERSPELQFLESVTHPRIEARIRQQIEDLQQRGTPVIVLDAALLLEVGWAGLCDWILFVEVDREQRWQRARERGWTEAQFAAREATQFPLATKRKLAQKVIDNSASIDHTLSQIQQLWRSLILPPPE